MDITKLTHEERNALTALVRSPGWALLMEKLFIPQVQLATQFLDRPAAEQSGKADWLRGVKASYVNLVDVVYRIAGIESPFTRHAIGLLVEMRQLADTAMERQNGTLTAQATENQKRELAQATENQKRELAQATENQKREFQRARSGFPV